MLICIQHHQASITRDQPGAAALYGHFEADRSSLREASCALSDERHPPRPPHTDEGPDAATPPVVTNKNVSRQSHMLPAARGWEGRWGAKSPQVRTTALEDDAWSGVPGQIPSDSQEAHLGEVAGGDEKGEGSGLAKEGPSSGQR
uniref:Uncharacterized protein n=1 Tax=Rangifer tarandus platyrhynchus TaxID=3082113 RepID=A0ACB0E9G9_RANTA|nr:unnamed protein product [Rangifer tarandus platyrhynchus]